MTQHVDTLEHQLNKYAVFLVCPIVKQNSSFCISHNRKEGRGDVADITVRSQELTQTFSMSLCSLLWNVVWPWDATSTSPCVLRS